MFIPEATGWQTVQSKIWTCEFCLDQERVACNIRQQTEVPPQNVKLLLVGIAPPYVSGVEQKTKARSATNDPKDNLRKLFILPTLADTWENLLTKGVYLIHSVKCAITVKDRHQNPPDYVVDVCAPSHFVQEVMFIRPPRVVVFGKSSYRALLKIPGIRVPSGLGISSRISTLTDKTKNGLEIQADGWEFTVHISPFPLELKKPSLAAQKILSKAAKLAGVLP